jgi:hypothetical protein
MLAGNALLSWMIYCTLRASFNCDDFNINLQVDRLLNGDEQVREKVTKWLKGIENGKTKR